MYHGTPAERAELRRTVMSRPAPKPRTKGRKAAKPTRAPAKKPQNRRNKGKQGKNAAKTPEIISDIPLRRSRRSRNSTIVIESDDDANEEDLYIPDEDDDESEVMEVDNHEEDAENISFPIVLTTYEMIIKDRVHLAHYNWGYIVVDEGHRLKNLDCKLMKEIKKYKSAGRMILTGTPLHVLIFFPWLIF